ncbi:MAG: hypothetical protein KC501_20010, partial [Myxococcales bacterium]|nr:hypothetical protein [Myxococcales bacterium]
MPRPAPLLALLLAACAPRTTPPTPPAEPVPAQSHAPAPTPPTTEAAAPDPLAQAIAIIDALAPRSRYLSDQQERQLREEGLDAPLATVALAELLRRCPSELESRCGDHASEIHVSIMLDLLRDHGSPEALPVVLQLDARGYFAWTTAESILAREMDAAATPCTPPDDDEVASARASLAGFRVIDREGKRLVARPPTAAELDDLAYLYAAVSESAPAVGEQSAHAVPSRDIDPSDAGRRHEQLERLSDAFQQGDLIEARASAVAYLGSLGYPGPIDATREADQTWGGARFSYVMRDLALVSEVVGELTTASDLYLHANPGGGMCGTSTDYRRGKQLRGFIRTQERLGQCRTVVAHRLLDWDDDYDPHDPEPETTGVGYGPGRLARDGWDVPRIYRG